MNVESLQEIDEQLPSVQGCAVGFVDSQTGCDEVVHALNIAGIPGSKITVLTGPDGIELFKTMMGRSSWGEEAEDSLKQGVVEMEQGHSTIIIEVQDRDAAVVAANLSAHHGGHGFRHFGLLIDERLTK
jgi:hypothetical protein